MCLEREGVQKRWGQGGLAASSYLCHLRFGFGLSVGGGAGSSADAERVPAAWRRPSQIRAAQRQGQTRSPGKETQAVERGKVAWPVDFFLPPQM